VFVDPILSTGFLADAAGIERRSALSNGTAAARPDAALEEDGAHAAEADTAVPGRALGSLPRLVFAALTHLYPAAASYAEAATRLDGHPGGRVPVRRSPVRREALRGAPRASALDASFEPRTRSRASAARSRRSTSWLEASRRNWYPVDAGTRPRRASSTRRRKRSRS
jgi:hypothetical protein